MVNVLFQAFLNLRQQMFSRQLSQRLLDSNGPGAESTCRRRCRRVGIIKKSCLEGVVFNDGNTVGRFRNAGQLGCIHDLRAFVEVAPTDGMTSPYIGILAGGIHPVNQTSVQGPFQAEGGTKLLIREDSQFSPKASAFSLAKRIFSLV